MYFLEVGNYYSGEILQLTEERSLREYEDGIRERQERLQSFIDSHIEEEKIRKYIEVKVIAVHAVFPLPSCCRRMRLSRPT